MKPNSLLFTPRLTTGSLFRSLAITSALFLSPTPPASALIVSTDVDFSVIYNATSLPNESNPVWPMLGNQAGTASVSGGVLTMDTPTDGARYYRISNSSIWDGSTATGSTIEFSMKIESLAAGSINTTAIYFSTGNKGYGFLFRPDGITYQGGTGTPVHDYDTTSDFNRYRITLSGSGEASLYVNDSPTPLISGYSGNTLSPLSNFIYFGDASNSALGGKVHLEYFAFTNAAAVAPIPEGNTAMLGLIGGGLLVGGFHLAKRRRVVSSR